MRRTADEVARLRALAVAVEDRRRQTDALGDIAIEHRAALTQILQTLIVIDPRHREVVRQLLDQVDRVARARRALGHLTAVELNSYQSELLP